MPFGSFYLEEQMPRQLLSVPYLSAIAAVAVMAASTAVAMYLPAFRSQTLSPSPASTVAEPAPQDGVRAAEEHRHAAAEARPRTGTPSNRWGAKYFPNVPVIDQNGRTLKFYDDVIKGKIVVISFIYTSCQDICPLTTARMAQLADKLGDVVGRDLFFISMTVDPENDTPEKMKAFADAFDVGPGWLFLTGNLADIRAINMKLGDRSDRGLSDHRNEIVIGNDEIGDWQRDSVFGDLDRLVITIRQMNPKWLNEVHLPENQPVKSVNLVLPDTPGQALFKKMCAPCHTIGVGDRVGPDLRDVTARRDRAWLESFIMNPKKVFADNDPIALELAARFPGVRMPALGIGKVDAQDLLSYLDGESARIIDAAPGEAPQAGHHHHH